MLFSFTFRKLFAQPHCRIGSFSCNLISSTLPLLLRKSRCCCRGPWIHQVDEHDAVSYVKARRDDNSKRLRRSSGCWILGSNKTQRRWAASWSTTWLYYILALSFWPFYMLWCEVNGKVGEGPRQQEPARRERAGHPPSPSEEASIVSSPAQETGRHSRRGPMLLSCCG